MDFMSLGAVPVPREKFLFWVAAALLVFNLVDALFTLVAVHAGAATEANPLMDVSLGWGSAWFVSIKLSLVSLGVLLLWRRRHQPLAAISLLAICVFYGGVVAYHLSSLDILLAHV